jgi:hypothetical protein
MFLPHIEGLFVLDIRIQYNSSIDLEYQKVKLQVLTFSDRANPLRLDMIATLHYFFTEIRCGAPADGAFYALIYGADGTVEPILQKT